MPFLVTNSNRRYAIYMSFNSQSGIEQMEDIKTSRNDKRQVVDLYSLALTHNRKMGRISNSVGGFEGNIKIRSHHKRGSHKNTHYRTTSHI